MRKISTVILGLFSALILSVVLAKPAYALDNPNRWTENGDFHNYVWYTGTYEIEDIDFTNYEFQYFKTGSGWKQLAPGATDTIRLTQTVGETFATRTVYLNEDVIASGTQGMYGDNQVIIEFRYKVLLIDDPVDPGESTWVENLDDGYFYFNDVFAENADTALAVDNLHETFFEYSVADANLPAEDREWHLVNLKEGNRLFVRNLTQNYSVTNRLFLVDGPVEKELAKAVTAVLLDDTVVTDRLYLRYKPIQLPNEPTHTINDLPVTTGSIFTQQMNMGRVYFQRDNLSLNLAVYYNGQSYYLNFGFAPNTDMAVFNNAYESFYYTHEGQKFIVINHGNTSMFLPDGSKDTFVPYTIWNLNTNELQTISRFSTYLYSKKEAANNVYAYFYVDEFVIDNLLSISLAYKYRYNFLIGDGDWHDQYVYLENNVNATGLSPTAWQFDVMTGTAAAMLAGSQIPVLRWPILAFGTAVMATVGSTVDEQIIEFGNIEQIQKLTSLSPQLETELSQAFNKADTNFDDFNNPVFKLHLGQFNALFSTGIEIDQEYSVVDGQKGINIIQFTYQTKGQVYTIDGSNINVEFTPGPGTDGQSGSILDNIITIGIVVIAGLVFMSLIKQGVFTNTKKLKAFIISLIVFALIGFVIYYLVITGGTFSFNLVT